MKLLYGELEKSRTAKGILNALKRKGVTAAQEADFLGVGKSAVPQWRTGKTKPT